MWNPKMVTRGLCYKTETASQTETRNLRLPKGKGGGLGEVSNFGLTYTQFYFSTKAHGIPQGQLLNTL